jgi:YtkA-like
MTLTRAQAPSAGGARTLDRLVRGVFIGGGLLALTMLAWGHLGLGALLFPPANAASVQTAVAGPYQVSYARPATGFTVGKENMALITVVGQNGAPVDGASISVGQEMTTMPMSVPPAAVTPQGGGRYQARMMFSMAGSWRVTISIARPGQAQSQVAFDASVRWK